MPPSLPSQQNAFASSSSSASSSHIPHTRNARLQRSAFPLLADDPDDLEPDLPVHRHVPPVGHGPPALPAAPPSFIKAVGMYDEYGRPLKGAEKGKGKEKDTGAAEFWRGVQLPSSSKEERSLVEDEPTNLISGTAHTETQTEVTPALTLKALPARSNTSTPSSKPPATIKIPKSQWFIRRALLARSQVPSSTASSASSTPQSSSPSTSRSSSVAALLDLPPPPSSGGDQGAQGWQPPAYIALRPDNVGYRMLVDGGWEGGGLGARLIRTAEATGIGAEGSLSGKGRRKDKEKARVSEAKVEDEIKPDTNLDLTTPVDLTADPSDESDIEILDEDPSQPSKFGDSYFTPPTSSPVPHSQATHGSGRVAPIATYLKSDLHGLGYRPAKSTSSLRRPVGAPQKKRVTHTESELRALKRGKVIGREGERERERKWVVREAKRDKEERGRWREILGS